MAPEAAETGEKRVIADRGGAIFFSRNVRAGMLDGGGGWLGSKGGEAQGAAVRVSDDREGASRRERQGLDGGRGDGVWR